MAKGRNYRSEYDNYHARPEQKKNRAQRNAARNLMKKKGAAVDGQDVDHAVPISKGGGNEDGNLRIRDKRKNRSFARTRDGAISP